MDSESEGWPMCNAVELVGTIDASRFSARQEAGMIYRSQLAFQIQYAYFRGLVSPAACGQQ
jgi:hypothetical protein